MAASRNVPLRGLDLSELLKLVEPITLYTTRITGGLRELVVPPLREGYAPGEGWTHAAIQQELDPEIQARHGFGSYEIQAKDSSSPPQVYKWTAYIREPNQVSKSYNPYESTPAVPPGWGSGWGNWGNRTGIGIGREISVERAATASSNNTDEAARLREQLHAQQLANQQQQFELSRRLDAVTAAPRDDARLEREREERMRLEREAAEARRAAEMASIEARHRSDLDSLKSLITQLAGTVQQIQSNPRSDEAAELRAELRRAEERRAADLALAEERRRSDAAAAELRQSMLQLQQQVASKPAGPDPMMLMLVEWMKMQSQTSAEQARMSAEAAKESERTRAEQARLQAESTTRLIESVRTAASAGNIPPLELIRMLREAGNGADQMMKTVLNTTTDMLDLHRNATASLLSMAPQGEGVAGRVVGAIEHAVETYSEGQARAAAAQASAAAQVARAQADAVMAQAQIAQANSGLGAPPAGASVVELNNPAQLPGTAAPIIAPSDAASGVVPLDQAAPAPTSVVTHGKSDEEWFGLALPRVHELRALVAAYLDAIDADEINLHQPEGEPIQPHDAQGKLVGASSFRVAGLLVRAIGQIAQLRNAGQLTAPIPAFDTLFSQQAYPALVDCVLPDPVPLEYRAEVVRYLWRHLNGEQLHNDVDPPLYGIGPFLAAAEEDEHADDHVTPPVKPNGAKPGRPALSPKPPRAPRARA